MPQPVAWILRPIRPADDAAVAAVIRDVMTEHDCCDDGFAIHDPEVANMSAHYQCADGQRPARYYVVARNGEVLGGGGFAQLAGTDAEARTCELRKMYFRPDARGHGLGRELMQLLLADMQMAGYHRCYLETTSWMDRAQALYRATGFRERQGPLGVTGHHGCDTFFERDLR